MGKNKLQKFAEMRTFPHVFQPNTLEYLNKDFDLKGKWNSDFFKNSNPIVLELACGKAEYTVGLAQKYPEKNFIAIDIKGARMWKGAKQTLEMGLKNTAFLRTRIEILDSFFAEDEVSEIWLPFPDPQPKKPSKRLTSPRFFNLYRKFLKDKSLIHLKTDNFYLFQYTLKVLEKNNVKPLIAVEDIYEAGLNNEVTQIKTFYEKQFLEEGKKITYLCFEFPKDKIWEDIPKNPPGSPYK